MTTWSDAMRMVGEEVVITLQHNPTVSVVGTLLDATDDGEVRYRRPDGEVRRAWPLLAIEPRYRPR